MENRIPKARLRVANGRGKVGMDMQRCAYVLLMERYGAHE